MNDTPQKPPPQEKPATVGGVLFLFAVTLGAVVLGAAVADRNTQPGLERTIAVALVALPIVMAAGWFAERRGWVRGRLDPSKPRSREGSESDSSGDPR